MGSVAGSCASWDGRANSGSSSRPCDVACFLNVARTLGVVSLADDAIGGVGEELRNLIGCLCVDINSVVGAGAIGGLAADSVRSLTAGLVLQGDILIHDLTVGHELIGNIKAHLYPPPVGLSELWIGLEAVRRRL